MGYNKDTDRRRDPMDRDNNPDRKRKKAGEHIPPPNLSSKKPSKAHSTHGPASRKERPAIPPPKISGSPDSNDPSMPDSSSSSKSASVKSEMKQPRVQRAGNNEHPRHHEAAGGSQSAGAIVALVLGILALLTSCFCGGFLFGIPAFITAIMAQKSIPHGEEGNSARTQVTVAKWLSGLAIAFSVIFIFVSLISNA
jgi:hypothetical protein